ncbi:hypothetical protein V8D89_014936 [Ganoderma adspersum]
MQPSRGVTYFPTSRGWVQAHYAQPFNSRPPPVPVGVHNPTWHTGGWQVNPTFHRAAHVQEQRMWLPHPAWYVNPSVGPPVADISQVPWLWVPRGVDVNNPAGYPASWSGGYLLSPQTEDSLPPSLPTSPIPDFGRLHASERVHHGRDTPHPHPGQLPPADDTYSPSPDYRPFRAHASPRVASTSHQRHAREASRSDTYSPFGSPEPTPVIPPQDIPSSGSSHRPSHAYPPGPSSHAYAYHYPSSSSYADLPPRNNPLPRPPEHHPLAQSLLRSANRPMAPDAPPAFDRHR